MRKAVIGILAHVDAGKTTLSEAILYKSGKLRKMGENAFKRSKRGSQASQKTCYKANADSRRGGNAERHQKDYA